MSDAWLMAGGAAGFLLLCFLIPMQMSYRIGHRHLKITVFGLPVRRILLTNIERVGKKELGGIKERWHNTWKVGHRQVIVRKCHGWPRELSLTPSQRYVFISDLDQAVARARAREDGQTAQILPAGQD